MPYRDKEKQKAYNRACYHRRVEQNRKSYRLNASTRVKENQLKVFRYLENHPCVDCGVSNPLVLEFDHIIPEDKFNCVSYLVCSGYGLDTILSEMEKCEVRCANCHRIKTAKVGNFLKHKIWCKEE